MGGGSLAQSSRVSHKPKCVCVGGGKGSSTPLNRDVLEGCGENLFPKPEEGRIKMKYLPLTGGHQLSKSPQTSGLKAFKVAEHAPKGGNKVGLVWREPHS